MHVFLSFVTKSGHLHSVKVQESSERSAVLRLVATEFIVFHFM